jgi:hypothetical protein
VLATIFICLLIGILLTAWLLGVFEQKPSGDTPSGEVTLHTYAVYPWENETQEQAPVLWDKVKERDEARFVTSEENSSVIVYMHPYRIGIFDPRTAEWIVIVSSIPENTTEVRVAIFRLDYQTSYLKIAYKFSYPTVEELTLEESIAIMRNEVWDIDPMFMERLKLLGGNYIYPYPACDFGGTIIVNKYAGRTVFHATTVWMGTGKLKIPEGQKKHQLDDRFKQ